ncbi:3-hydroxyacyl-ACP dehydratase [Paenibacillus oenotherae]|uniref:3-hydroxyacyl-ACP dehydratase n=1 Tax=Paenibacillus oenotherae TaxID=1435645 RepID=A0ABS7DBL6_9BACL|nr:MaoC/PaaZ C-terminal domain-containing protein [Paenibacillus oenotherae]MBW7477301.1 3-hydroxyacyl-ACP dehydratase [Paenibacillus oenotherae]
MQTINTDHHAVLEPLVKEPISPVQLVRYAGASGDFNPIHTVHDEGVRAGHGGVIAHGMLVMGFMAEAAGRWFPERRIRQMKARFIEPSRAGEILTVNGSITEVSGATGCCLTICDVVITNEHGSTKLLGRFGVEAD